ncbi:MAG: hypothetical protein Q8941_10385 [Bacteroidota bacterium]|nr:hypothetical protein [Bacteroidota bacterium]
MKQFRFLATLLATSMSLFLLSCGSGDNEKKADEKTKDTSQVKPAETTPATTAPAKPADLMVIQHKVANYAKWKPFYDGHDSARKANGLSNYVIARGIDDSNMVLIALKMSDIDKAKAMGGSQELKDRMKKAGVIGAPTISYVEEVMQDTTTIPQAARVRVTHKVKDWDAWKKEFDDHKQARMDAGLIDRVVGHSIGDNHMVTLVFAITDMAKAKAFMKSKDLKDKMAKAGVEGPPTFFFYNIVEKY